MKCQGKNQAKSGNLEVHDKWQSCTIANIMSKAWDIANYVNICYRYMSVIVTFSLFLNISCDNMYLYLDRMDKKIYHCFINTQGIYVLLSADTLSLSQLAIFSEPFPCTLYFATQPLAKPGGICWS